jgi:hypothetical protein
MNEVTAEGAENAAVNNLTNPRRTALDVSKTGGWNTALMITFNMRLCG